MIQSVARFTVLNEVGGTKQHVSTVNRRITKAIVTNDSTFEKKYEKIPTLGLFI